MSVAVVAIRQGVAAAIVAARGADGWRESTSSYAKFGEDGEHRLHLGFAVATPRTVPFNERQHVAMGVIVDTTVKVRWGYSLAALDQVASYDEALAQAALLINAVLTYADVPLVLVESLVPDDDQGWILGELTFRAIHRIALTT